MFRKYTFVIATLTSLAGVAHAETYPGGPRYDGTVTIKALSSGCSSLSDAVGDKNRAIFRSKSGGTPEAMSVNVLHGLLWIAAGFDGTLAGKNQLGTGTLIIDAFRSNLPDATFNLKFTPPVVDPPTPPSFKFLGNWRNYKVVGCTAKVLGKFTKRAP
jgi:hypothetical protein